MPDWRYGLYKMEEPAQCEADSIKVLKLEEVCEKRTQWAVRSPKGSFDYACCKAHREALIEKGML